jgi:hypothetical protein
MNVPLRSGGLVQRLPCARELVTTAARVGRNSRRRIPPNDGVGYCNRVRPDAEFIWFGR